MKAFFLKEILSYLLYNLLYITLGGQETQYYQGFTSQYMRILYVIHENFIRDT